MGSVTNEEETAGSDLDDISDKTSSGTKKVMAWRLLRKFYKSTRHIIKPILFIIINGIYLLLGAVVFLVLERQTNKQTDISTEILEILKAINDTKPDLINPSSLAALNPEKLTSNMSVNDVATWNNVLGNIRQRRVVAENSRWTLSRSIFFCTSLLTTIGYGNISPVTTAGRIFCIFYSCIGIPLNIMLLAVLGKLMANIINKFVAEFIRLWTNYLHPNYEWKSLNEKNQINAPVWLALIIFASFLLFFSFIYSLSEGWDYWTACYFTFITFTTIGLGDVVPQRTETMIFIDTTLLYFGLAVLALTVNLIVANVIEQFKKTRERLPFVDRLEMSSVASESN